MSIRCPPPPPPSNLACLSLILLYLAPGLANNSTLANLSIASNNATDACALAVANYLYSERGLATGSDASASFGYVGCSFIFALLLLVEIAVAGTKKLQ